MHQYGIKEILEKTHLQPSFVRKCCRRLRDLLKPFYITGDKGALLFNDSGLLIWDHIKQLKERGADINQIRKAVEKIHHPNQSTEHSSDEPEQPPAQPQTTEANQADKQKPNTYQDIKFVVEALKDAYETALKDREARVLLLTEGKDALEKKEAELKENVSNLKETVTIENQKRIQMQRLCAKLTTLNGWTQRKKRERVLKQIQELYGDGVESEGKSST